MKYYIKVENKKILDLKQQPFENYIEIESDLKSLEIISQYSYDGSKLVKNNTLDNLRAYEQELIDIEEWLKANDWKPNKVITGEWEATDIRWTSYLTERKAKRARQYELIKLLGV